jgi:hypothetical protein
MLADCTLSLGGEERTTICTITIQVLSVSQPACPNMSSGTVLSYCKKNDPCGTGALANHTALVASRLPPVIRAIVGLCMDLSAFKMDPNII